MQQIQNNQPPRKRENPFSKFKKWCTAHNVPVFVIPLICFAVIAVTAVLIGGAILGWNFRALIFSQTGLLIGVVLLLLALGLAYFIFTQRRR